MTAALSRRRFLAATTAATGAAFASCSSLASSNPGIVDTHTHFYDPTRAQGVPWPSKDDAVLYRAVYPKEFNRLAKPHGVVGTVVVEASPWLQDNQWILDLAAQESSIFGFVGQLKPGRSEFAAELKRFAANPLFRGIRIGAWDKRAVSADSELRRDLKLLADRDLSLDVLITTDGLEETARLAAAIPKLRIIIDHCANVRVDGAAPPAPWLDGLTLCARRPNVFMKVSGLVEGTGRTDGSASSSPGLYRPVLDAIWERFGEDRVLYGSNWPVSARFGSYATVFQIVHEYFTAKGEAQAAGYFWRNAARVYKFVRRGAPSS
jgi:predicted TIM-barrel fold metal-dependent hydrolase